MLAAIKRYPVIFVFALVTSVFLAFLGDWQYEKGHQRELSDAAKLNNFNKQIINLNNVYDVSKIMNGTKVVVEGRYDKNIIILHDNRLNLGKAGYHVYSIFHDIQGQSFLINRGWVSMNLDRRILPKVEINDEIVLLEGVVRYPIKGVYTLQDEELKNVTFPLRVQTIDIIQLESVTGNKIEAFAILLDKNMAGAHFSRNWDDLLPGKYMSADKHYAYSAQWYSLAVVGLVVFMVLIMKMAKNEHE